MEKERFTFEQKTQRGIKIAIIGAIIFFIVSAFFILIAMFTSNYEYPFNFISFGGTFAFSHVAIGQRNISLVAILYSCGFICSSVILCCRRHLINVKYWEAPIIATIFLLSAYIGAKILYILEDIPLFLEEGFTFSGVSFFGAVLLMVPLVTPSVFIFKKKLGAYLDYCIPAIIIMLIWIRVSCFTAGCCGGNIIFYKHNPIVIPTQLLEIVLDFILLAFIYYFEGKGFFKNVRYAIFMIGYGILRFIIEPMRNTRKNIAGMSEGQWLAILTILIGLAVIFIHQKKNKAVQSD